MRRRIADAKGTLDPWDLKQVRGGLVDIEFIIQYLQLIFAAEHPDVLHQNTLAALSKLAERVLLPPAAAETLALAGQSLGNLTQVLRLSLEGAFAPDAAPDGLKRLLARVADTPHFDHLARELIGQQLQVHQLFDELVV
jgi:[glutamine synthetase] adenylyltransferase / [glutamine synthetase]-adenylyl-L-tyrosine phosphorylase